MKLASNIEKAIRKYIHVVLYCKCIHNTACETSAASQVSLFATASTRNKINNIHNQNDDYKCSKKSQIPDINDSMSNGNLYIFTCIH